MKKSIVAVIFISLAVGILYFISGCRSNEPEGCYYFNGFKIFSNGFIWGRVSIIPISGNMGNSTIYYKRETDDLKEIHFMATGDVSLFEKMYLIEPSDNSK